MKSYQQLYKYAKQLALKWRHTASKIKEKLLLKGASSIEIDKIIFSLINDKVLDDNKCFELDVFAMEEKRYGYKRIKEYLCKKGYDRELLDKYIFNKDIEKDNCYYHFFKGSKKYKNYKSSDIEREKLINYLKRNGFNDTIITEVIKVGIKYEDVM